MSSRLWCGQRCSIAKIVYHSNSGHGWRTLLPSNTYKCYGHRIYRIKCFWCNSNRFWYIFLCSRCMCALGGSAEDCRFRCHRFLSVVICRDFSFAPLLYDCFVIRLALYLVDAKCEMYHSLGFEWRLHEWQVYETHGTNIKASYFFVVGRIRLLQYIITSVTRSTEHYI